MTVQSKGTLYLIPVMLGATSETMDVLPQKINRIINQIDEFIVENEKSARHFLKKIGIQKPLQEIKLYPLNEHTPVAAISDYIKPLAEGKNMGIISEAGCPGIADPGANVVALAHQKNIRVVPLVGPSSVLLSLMASGFNGQQFVFHGYLPKERTERIKKIKELEKQAIKGYTQLFIETPYRNMHLLEDIVTVCNSVTLLCIACNITEADEFIQTKTIRDWKKQLPSIAKKPTIFLIGSS